MEHKKKQEGKESLFERQATINVNGKLIPAFVSPRIKSSPEVEERAKHLYDGLTKMIQEKIKNNQKKKITNN